MTKILFVCHGNICRSPSAEFYMKELVLRAGLQDEFEIASAATHTDEIGSPVYPPSRKVLEKHGIDCSGKTARLMSKKDYAHYDLLIGMDEENLRDMKRISGGDPENKIHNLLDYADRPGEPVADPWYTRDFDITWRDIGEGCQGLLDSISGIRCVDFSACTERDDFYRILRAIADWPSAFGNNLDAVFHILISPSQKGKRYLLLPPEASAPREAHAYYEKIFEIFDDAGNAVT